MLEVLKNEEFNMEEQAVEGYDCLNDCGSGGLRNLYRFVLIHSDFQISVLRCKEQGEYFWTFPCLKM